MKRRCADLTEKFGIQLNLVVAKDHDASYEQLASPAKWMHSPEMMFSLWVYRRTPSRK